MKHKKKKPQSIVLPVTIITMVMLLLLATGWQLAERNFDTIVPIENVEIEGTIKNLSLADVRSAVTGVLDGGYFTVNLVNIRNALLQLPWVEDASIRRHWPSGLHIKIIEKQAVAYWGESSLLSSKGVLFSPVTFDTGWPLPKLDGPAGLHEKVLGFLAEITLNFKMMDINVTQLELDDRRAWRMKISDGSFPAGIEVKLGRSDTASRLARFVRVFSDRSVLNLADVDVIDMRYPNGFAMHTQNKDKNMTFNQVGRIREV